MSSTGSKKFRKICFCNEKFAENSSDSFDCSSSAVSMTAENEEKKEPEKKLKKDKSGIFSSFFTTKIFSRGFKKDSKTDNSMMKIERSTYAGRYQSINETKLPRVDTCADFDHLQRKWQQIL